MSKPISGFSETRNWFEIEYVPSDAVDGKRTGYTTNKDEAKKCVKWPMQSYDLADGGESVRKCTERLDGGWNKIGDTWITDGRTLSGPLV